MAARTLSFFHEYFDIAYPLPKMDLLAIPDFAAGAMENWGAVTYRETAILVDPEESSAGTRQRVAIIVAHELAHQWFGNLVTMEWWTHLWLNEGFASWIEFLAVDHLFPEWDMWTQFVYTDFGRALSLDGLKSSHPIEVEVRDPKQISEIFDGISYSKGASVIRMLCAYHRRGAVPPRVAALPRAASIRQRHHRGPVAGPGGRVRAAGEADHGHLDQADGLSAGVRGREAGRGGAAADPVLPERRAGTGRYQPVVGALGYPEGGGGGYLPCGRRRAGDNRCRRKPEAGG